MSRQEPDRSGRSLPFPPSSSTSRLSILGQDTLHGLRRPFSLLRSPSKPLLSQTTTRDEREHRASTSTASHHTTNVEDTASSPTRSRMFQHRDDVDRAPLHEDRNPTGASGSGYDADLDSRQYPHTQHYDKKFPDSPSGLARIPAGIQTVKKTMSSTSLKAKGSIRRGFHALRGRFLNQEKSEDVAGAQSSLRSQREQFATAANASEPNRSTRHALPSGNPTRQTHDDVGPTISAPEPARTSTSPSRANRAGIRPAGPREPPNDGSPKRISHTERFLNRRQVARDSAEDESPGQSAVVQDHLNQDLRRSPQRENPLRERHLQIQGAGDTTSQRGSSLLALTESPTRHVHTRSESNSSGATTATRAPVRSPLHTRPQPQSPTRDQVPTSDGLFDSIPDDARPKAVPQLSTSSCGSNTGSTNSVLRHRTSKVGLDGWDSMRPSTPSTMTSPDENDSYEKTTRRDRTLSPSEDDLQIRRSRNASTHAHFRSRDARPPSSGSSLFRSLEDGATGGARGQGGVEEELEEARETRPYASALQGLPLPPLPLNIRPKPARGRPQEQPEHPLQRGRGRGSEPGQTQEQGQEDARYQHHERPPERDEDSNWWTEDGRSIRPAHRP